MLRLMTVRYHKAKRQLKEMLAGSRKVTVCLDEWTTKGYSCSYLGLSACFFDTLSSSVKHAILSLSILPHPHTGEVLAKEIAACFDEWGIDSNKVLLIVTDNASNVVKGMKILQTKQVEKEKEEALRQSETGAAGLEGEEGDTDEEGQEVDLEVEIEAGEDSDKDEMNGDESNDESDQFDDGDSSLEEDVLELPKSIPFRRMPCLAHTLQLVIKLVFKKHFAVIVMKARRVVGNIRKSSVAVQKLVERCGKTVVVDCTTRWNSTFYMAERLLLIKEHVNAVLGEIGADTLLSSEWIRLEEMASLLKPFAAQTDILQTDSKSLSHILPSLLELQYHLLALIESKRSSVASLMLTDLRSRFSSILDPTSYQFNPLPAAACFLDHTVSSVLLLPDMNHLLESAKAFITSQVS